MSVLSDGAVLVREQLFTKEALKAGPNNFSTLILQ
jgi:hypothetical protein